MIETRVCAGPLHPGGVELTVDDFSPDGYGGLRTSCKRCRVEEELARRRALRDGGVRRCRECKEKRKLADFEAHECADGIRYSTTCRACVEREAVDALAESEADLADGLRRNLRWAVSLKKVLDAAGFDLRAYKALHGEDRKVFEAVWSEVMRDMARKAGEWPAEYDAARGGLAERERMAELACTPLAGVLPEEAAA